MSLSRGSMLFVGLVFSAASLLGQTSNTIETPEVSSSANQVIALNAGPEPAAVASPEVATVAPAVRPVVMVAPVKPTSIPEDPHYARNKKIWYSLTAMNHTAAFVDAYSTRRAVQRGAQELNPLMKPFADSNAMYAATQFVPFGMDYLGHRMMKSSNPVVRKLWWVPQTASTAASIAAGIHNLSVK